MNVFLKRSLFGIALVALLAAPALARPGGHGGRHGPKLHKLIEALDLDEATAAKVKAQFEAGREAGKALREQKRAERDKLHTLMEADSPDRAAIMAQIEKVGQIKIQLEKQRMESMLAVRELLTPAQRAKLKEMRGKRGKMGKRGRRGGKRGKWRRGGGEGPPDDDRDGPPDEGPEL